MFQKTWGGNTNKILIVAQPNWVDNLKRKLMGNTHPLHLRSSAVPGATPARDIVQRQHVRKHYRVDKDVLGVGAFATVR